MSEQIHGVRGVADKRYYHFVVFEGDATNVAACWRKLQKLGTVERANTPAIMGAHRGKWEHRKLRLDRSYGRGAVNLTLSEQGRGQPPYFYDVFAGTLAMGKVPTVVLGFPFAQLALELIDHLLASGSVRNSAFLGVDMSGLLNEKNRSLPHQDHFSASVIGVQFVVMDDNSLTAVRLGGDAPFKAEIYRSFLKPKFEKGTWMPDQCVLACKREVEPSRTDATTILRSRLHLDRFGNYKFYTHAGCSNISLMADALLQIHAAGSFKSVYGNPLRKIQAGDVD